ncbi:hypothetical protein CLV28_2390 [Sediminihabitans luteus]|uniref:Ig-like protein group 3 n=1 Tax=Sediminihabitans luteus TaxID=1138585 RepID=A0A2M9CDE1_9CELL|nr:Ig-like domain-containing protein [Sediminihabitans luteus]PJJ69913.1 hypothetical protein CLV28_2390 [Sediminihabitans luteus]GII99233.1 hypothetical protein Slu03_16110 [Sediminihabitans luteus]
MPISRKLWLGPTALAATCVTAFGIVAAPAAVAAESSGPSIDVKSESVGTDGRYRSVSFKLHDADKVVGLSLNGTPKPVTANQWSDLNGVKPGVYGAVEGANTLVVTDALGNATTLVFTLDTTGPQVTVKDGALGANGVYRNVSFKLHDGAKVDRLTLNGVEKDLTDNVWSDLNGVKPGTFGAVEGLNKLVVTDALGNATTLVFTLDTTGPDATVKDGAEGADGVYRNVSFKLHDANKVDRLTLNGVEKDLTDNVWSDLNGVKPGAFGAVEGLNTLVLFDVAGNSTTVTFTLDTTGPEVTVKPESDGTDGVYRNVSFKLHDANKVDRLTLNGVEKNLTDNAWSDLNGVKPGTFGAVEGLNTLVVSDVLGNSTTVTFTLEVEKVADTTRPVVRIVTPETDAVVTSAAAGDVQIDASDDTSLRRVAANLYYKDGGFFKNIGSTSATTALASAAWNGGWKLPAGLPEGVYTIRAGAHDTSDNWGGAERTITVDDTAPVLSVPAGPVLVSGTHTFAVSQVEANPDWSYVEIDQIGADGKWVKKVGQRFEGVNDLGFTVDTATLADGVRTQLKVTSVDAAGHRVSKTVEVVVDNAAPVISVPAGPVLVGGTHTFAVSQVEAHPERAYVEIDQIVDGKWVKKAGQWFTGTNDLAFTVDTTALVDGARTQLKVTSYDAAGNKSGASTEVVVDNTAPAITVPAASTVSGTHTFDVSQVEAHPERTYVEIDQIVDGTWAKKSGQWFTGSNEFGFTVDTTALVDGARTQVKVTSYDAVGNKSSATVEVTVDNAPAAVTTPATPLKPAKFDVQAAINALIAQILKMLSSFGR